MLYYIAFVQILIFLPFFSWIIFFRVLPLLGDGGFFLKYFCVASLFALISFVMTMGQRLSKQTRGLYENVLQLCGELSDMIDWSTMRKRQVYKPLEQNLQNPIDDFYTYSISILCPFYGGKVLLNVLFICLMIEVLSIFVYALLFFML